MYRVAMKIRSGIVLALDVTDRPRALQVADAAELVASGMGDTDPAAAVLRDSRRAALV